jgi:hypothetical protein
MGIMALDVRQVFVVGIIALLITRFYLEKQFKRIEIFWIYTFVSLILGISAAITVISNSSAKQYFIPFTAISVVLAIIYHPTQSDSSTTSS